MVRNQSYRCTTVVHVSIVGIRTDMVHRIGVYVTYIRTMYRYGTGNRCRNVYYDGTSFRRGTIKPMYYDSTRSNRRCAHQNGTSMWCHVTTMYQRGTCNHRGCVYQRGTSYRCTMRHSDVLPWYMLPSWNRVPLWYR